MNARAWSLIGGVAATVCLLSTAWAHHGWAWAEEQQTEMSGTILEVYIGPPHPRLQIETADDGRWTVDLGNPQQSRAAGFVEGEAKAGDKVVVRGHRSKDAAEKRIKAVRITIDGRRYDFYPDRIQGD